MIFKNTNEEEAFWGKVYTFREKYGWGIRDFSRPENKCVTIPIKLEQAELDFFTWIDKNDIKMRYVDHDWTSGGAECEVWYIPDDKQRILVKMLWG